MSCQAVGITPVDATDAGQHRRQAPHVVCSRRMGGHNSRLNAWLRASGAAPAPGLLSGQSTAPETPQHCGRLSAFPLMCEGSMLPGPPQAAPPPPNHPKQHSLICVCQCVSVCEKKARRHTKKQTRMKQGVTCVCVLHDGRCRPVFIRLEGLYVAGTLLAGRHSGQQPQQDSRHAGQPLENVFHTCHTATHPTPTASQTADQAPAMPCGT